MSWDWDKLKQQQQGRGGGAPPPMDEILDRVKKFKMPGGGPLVILVIVIIFIASSTFYTIKQDEVGIGELPQVRDLGLEVQLDAEFAGALV